MGIKNALTDEQRKQMVADYAAGNLVSDICKKYKVSKSTLDYWVTKSGVKNELQDISTAQSRSYQASR
jgi:transposase-like protein